MRLKDRCALVTGAASGIGAAIARACARANAICPGFVRTPLVVVVSHGWHMA